MSFKVIIAGGREFDDYKQLCETADHMLQNKAHIEVVSGVARGADTLGEKYAKERGYALKQFPANWNKHGLGAGPIRNAEMADYGDGLLAFWDGESKGTKNMIEVARIKDLQLKVVLYQKK